MLLQDIMRITGAEPLTTNLDPQQSVRCGFASDLMSDVLRFDVSAGLLVTGLANPQVIRTTEMADVAAVLLVRGKVPPPETKQLAEEVGIPLLGTDLTMFEICGRLYAAGLPACRRTDNQS